MLLHIPISEHFIDEKEHFITKENTLENIWFHALLYYEHIDITAVTTCIIHESKFLKRNSCDPWVSNNTKVQWFPEIFL